MSAVRVTAVVVSHDSACDLHELLPLLAHPEVEVVVVDNASTDDSAEIAAACGADVTRLPLNVGWARGCNLGAGRATAPAVAFVNPDARPGAPDLLALADHVGSALSDESRVGAVSAAFRNPDGSPQSFYFRFPGVLAGLFCFLNAGQRLDQLLGRPFMRHRSYDFDAGPIAEVDQPGAACLVIPTVTFRALGGFDDDFFLFFADTDLCRRLRDRQLSVDVRWDVPVVHRGMGSVSQLSDVARQRHLQRDYLTYVRRHHGPLAHAATAAGVLVLTGLVPALTRLVRLRPRDAAEQLVLAWQVLR